jgi:hypothetical protein
MMLYNYFKRLNIETSIKALSMWKRASIVFSTAGRGPALRALGKILYLRRWHPQGVWSLNPPASGSAFRQVTRLKAGDPPEKTT